MFPPRRESRYYLICSTVVRAPDAKSNPNAAAKASNAGASFEGMLRFKTLCKESKEKGRLVSQTAFPVLRQLHIDGRSQDVSARGPISRPHPDRKPLRIGAVANWSPNRRGGFPSP
jgi:hypothetical protein